MEDIIEKELVSNDSDDEIDFTARRKHGKQALRIDETDSEDENSIPLEDVDPVETGEIRGGGRNSEDDSNESKDSSDDDEKFSSSTQRKKKNTKKKKKSHDQEVSDEHKSKMNALCDEESSSDESDKQEDRVDRVETKKTQKLPQRMSAKQAEEQMKIIQSESQRLARECHLSVPYHKPKQHSLKDFLNRRTINRPVPMALTKKAAATIKMSKEELEQYAKSLEDRNKESQEFYRSDSDNSNNDEKENTSDCDKQQNPQQDETNDLVESSEAVNQNEESMDCTSNVAGSTEVIAVTERSSEAPMTNVELTETANVVEYTAKPTNIEADANNVETEIAEKITTDALTENSTTSAVVNENEVEKRETAIKTKETIEIDYGFGENERSETVKDLLPLYTTVKPCLKGPVNGIIDLDDDITPCKSGSDELLERFRKHVAKKPNSSAKEISILSTDHGIVELNNIKLESDDSNCIHSQPRKDVFKLKEELSLRIAAKRKEELKKKQVTAIEIPMDDSDDDYDMKSCKEKEIESSNDVNGSNDKENYESDVEEIDNGNINENDDEGINEDEEINDSNDESQDDEENEADDEEKEDEMDSERNTGCELGQKPKQRKRIILLDNSDDDDGDNNEKSQDGKLENSTLDSTLMSLEENSLLSELPIDKTMSQICENQSRADEMIDSCSKIVPEKIDTQTDNMSRLFTQTTDAGMAELLDLCSGSFVTQPANLSYVEPENESNFETQVNNFSDNEFSDDEIGVPKKSKQRKKVNISDDEDQATENANIPQNDESNTSDNARCNESDDADDLSQEEVEKAVRIVEYDSEENEIEVVPLAQKKKIADFFEDEAELSESEWGSADEDERNLDKFDIELGDEDEFDQNQLVSELDRIHRRRMLDQDAREVKIIKDTHFEDEEESGFGRQRQYKWKHMENSLNIDENQKTEDLDENGKSDDENEESWRRMRHERNNILQETKDENEKINESKLIVATKTKKRISIVKTAANLNTSATKDLSFLISRMKEEQTHRSSLLIRDEATLANLAKMTTDDSIPSINSTSKNFLFNVVSSDDGKTVGKRKLDDAGTEGENKKRKTTTKIKKSTLSVLDKLL